MKITQQTTQMTQRKDSRYVTYLDATLGDAKVAQGGVVLSISQGGLFVATEYHAPPGKKLTISFADPDGGRVEVEGLVIYRSICQGHEGLGMKFMVPNATQEVIESIRFWCQQYIGLR